MNMAEKLFVCMLFAVIVTNIVLPMGIILWIMVVEFIEARRARKKGQ